MESRMETYLNAAISGDTENLPNPISRIDFLLCELIKTLGESGASIEEVEKIVTDKVAEIVADAPEDFDTLKELSDWIYTHEESAATMNTAIQSKVDKEEGKSLISDSEITRLANVENYDDTQMKEYVDELTKYTNIAYGTCTTAAKTAEKAVTIIGNPNWKLQVGSIIVVKSSYTNSANNPTLNVNGTGAKSIWYNTALVTTSSLPAAGSANRYIKYFYDGLLLKYHDYKFALIASDGKDKFVIVTSSIPFLKELITGPYKSTINELIVIEDGKLSFLRNYNFTSLAE